MAKRLIRVHHKRRIYCFEVRQNFMKWYIVMGKQDSYFFERTEEGWKQREGGRVPDYLYDQVIQQLEQLYHNYK